MYFYYKNRFARTRPIFTSQSICFDNLEAGLFTVSLYVIKIKNLNNLLITLILIMMSN